MCSKTISTLKNKIYKIENSSNCNNSCLESKSNNKERIKKEVHQCLQKIILLSNYKERCTEETYNRLVMEGKFNIDIINEAIDKAVEYKIIDNNRYAQFYLLSKFNNHYGINGILKHLDKMKINYLDNKQFYILLNDCKEKEYDLAINFIKRHPSKAKNKYRSIFNKLYRRGYSLDITKKIAHKYC